MWSQFPSFVAISFKQNDLKQMIKDTREWNAALRSHGMAPEPQLTVNVFIRMGFSQFSSYFEATWFEIASVILLDCHHSCSLIVLSDLISLSLTCHRSVIGWSGETRIRCGPFLKLRSLPFRVHEFNTWPNTKEISQQGRVPARGKVTLTHLHLCTHPPLSLMTLFNSAQHRGGMSVQLCCTDTFA